MVRLLPESDGAVRHAYFTQGREADKAEGDPMKVYVSDKKEGIYALGLSAGKAAWRDLHAYLRPKKAANIILHHAAVQEMNGVLPPTARYGLNVVGLATDPGKAGKFLLWRHDRMSLPAVLLADVDRIQTVEVALGDAEFVAWEMGGRIRRVAARYLPPEGNPDPKDVDKLSLALDTRADFWARLEERFAFLLDALAGEGLDAALEEWRNGVEREAEAALHEACDQLGHSARAIRATAEVSFKFEANRAAVEQRRQEAGKKKRKGGQPT
jgi:CRISPR system Cascade subunit CasA